MNCESCHERQATVVFTTVIEDEKTVLHLCGACAKALGLDSEPYPQEEGASVMENHAPDPEYSGSDAKLRCPNCGLTYAKFKERYRLGCADCYAAFSERLVPLLRKVHGAEAHVGKRFVRAAEAASTERKPPSGAWTLELLKRRLNAAIEREEFEEAARLRDQIKESEKKQG